MEDFLSKLNGGKEAALVIVLDSSHAHKVEIACKDNNFLVLDKTEEIINELRVANKIAIPLYRIENEDDIYNIVMGYTTGQISIMKDNKRIFVNPKYTNSSVVLLITHDFLKSSKHDWLSITGLAYQPE